MLLEDLTCGLGLLFVDTSPALSSLPGWVCVGELANRHGKRNHVLDNV